MTTIVKDGASGAVGVILALLVVAVVGFMIYAFSSGQFNAPRSNTIQLSPPVSAPSAPSVPSGQ
jgi:hypothetical protein